MLSFSNNFWGKDTKGSETLIHRMHEAKQTLEETIAFYKERQAIEDDYGKRLQALSRKALGSKELGTLKSSLECVRLNTGVMAATHITAAAQIKSQLLQPLETFAASVRARRKTIEQQVEKNAKARDAQALAVERARDKFEQDCNRLNAFNAQQNMLVGRELEKNNAKIDKFQYSTESDKREYQSALRTLADLIERYNADWKDSCDRLEELENERSAFLKSNLWTLTNIISSSCVSDDESSESIRLMLEKCDFVRDKELFVRQNAVSNEIYDVPLFIDYSSGHSRSSKPTPFKLANFDCPKYPTNKQSASPTDEALPKSQSATHDLPPFPSKQSSSTTSSPTKPTSRERSQSSVSPSNTPNLSSGVRTHSRSYSHSHSSSSFKTPLENHVPLNPPHNDSNLNTSLNSSSGDSSSSMFAARNPSPESALSHSASGSSNRTSISSISEDHRPRWTSPFRRRSKSSLRGWNTNIEPDAPPAPTRKSVLNMGNNMFDLNLPSGQKALQQSTNSLNSSGSSDRSATAKTLKKDDPLLQALERLRLDSTSSRSEQTPSGSSSPSKSNSLTSQHHNVSLIPPSQAYMASDMQSATKHFQSRTQAMFSDHSTRNTPDPYYSQVRRSQSSDLSDTASTGGRHSPSMYHHDQPPGHVSPTRRSLTHMSSEKLSPSPPHSNTTYSNTSGRVSPGPQHFSDIASGRVSPGPHRLSDVASGRVSPGPHRLSDVASGRMSPGPHRLSDVASGRVSPGPQRFSDMASAGRMSNGRASPNPSRMANMASGRVSPGLQGYSGMSSGRVSPGPQRLSDIASGRVSPGPQRLSDMASGRVSPGPQRLSGMASGRMSPGPHRLSEIAASGRMSPGPQRLSELADGRVSPRPSGRGSPNPQRAMNGRSSPNPQYASRLSYRPSSRTSHSRAHSRAHSHSGHVDDAVYESGQRNSSSNLIRFSSNEYSGYPVSPLRTSKPSDSRNSDLPVVARDGRPVLLHARAQYDYRAAIPAEVSFRKGDLLSVLRKQPDGWWEVEVLGRKARIGLAPSNFLAIL